jgi:putative membrane protein insertion efficiency factor
MKWIINHNPVKYLFLGLIKVYKISISPLLGPICRFHPTCSTYSYESIKKHGAFKGLYLSIIRISKCHPFHPGGYDPIP